MNRRKPLNPKQLKDAMKGVIHLVMTPFDDRDELDEKALRRTVRDAVAALKGDHAEIEKWSDVIAPYAAFVGKKCTNCGTQYEPPVA